jgi:hypothetical protein
MLDASFPIFIPEIDALPDSIRIEECVARMTPRSAIFRGEEANPINCDMRTEGVPKCHESTMNIPLDTRAQQTYTYASESYIGN